MATNPKPLRGKEFETWYQARVARYESGEMGVLARFFHSSKKRAGKLYRAHLDYQKLIARWTEAGWQGYNGNGQWIRRTSKRKRRSWKTK